MNDTVREPAELRVLEAALEEEVGGARPPDLRGRVLGAPPERVTAAVERLALAERRSVAPHRLWAAAVVVLGAAAVFGTLLGPRRAAQAPVQRIVRPLTVEELQRELPRVEAVTVRVLSTGLMTDVRLPRIPEGATELTDPAVVARIVAGLRRCEDDVQGARWAWSNEVLLHLRGGGVVRCSAIGEGAASWPRLAVEGWDRDRAMPAEVYALFEPTLDALTRAASRHAGAVLSRAELAELAASADAPVRRELRLLDAGTGLPALDAFPDLRVLHVTRGGGKVSREDIAKLRSLRRLEEVVLPGMTVEDRWLAELTQLPRLRVLDLSSARSAKPRTRLTGAGFLAFKAHTALSELRLNDCDSLTEGGLAAVAAIPRLARLELRRARADLDLSALAGAARLEALDLSAARTDVDAALPAIAELPRLRTLLLADTRVTAEGLATLESAPALRVLDLEGVARRDVLDVVARLTALRELVLSHGPGVDDEALPLLLPLTELRRLELIGCDLLRPRSLDTLAKMRHLRALDLRGCDGIEATPARREALRLALPECDVRW